MEELVNNYISKCELLGYKGIKIKIEEDDVILERAPKIAEFKIPEFITIIGRGAFLNNKCITKVEIPKSVHTIRTSAFHMSGITKIVIPSTIKKLGIDLFSYSALEEVIIEEGITNIPRSAFVECRDLKYVKLPKSLKSIDVWAFGMTSSLKHINLKNVEVINELAFNESALQKVILGKNIRKVGCRAFEECRKLKEFKCKYKIKKFGPRVFSKCNNIETIDINIVKGGLAENAFEDIECNPRVTINERKIDISKYIRR